MIYNYHLNNKLENKNKRQNFVLKIKPWQVIIINDKKNFKLLIIEI